MLNIKPNKVWDYFEEISAIPRCSGHEEKVREYLLRVADRHDLSSRVDGVGNVLLSQAGQEGTDVPLALLQSHMDMVCEKNSDVDHDFSKDPIEIMVEDGWVTADGTTLGADNGIGMAIALALATGDFDFAPLDFLFTVNEETGLVGASGLDPDLVRSDRLINLDSEEFGTFTIGCAGGGTTTINLQLDFSGTEVKEGDLLKVSIAGLTGGHSGEDIDANRANALKLLARVLEEMQEGPGLKLVEIEGGGKHNAIPREASAIFSRSKTPDLYQDIVDQCRSIFLEEYRNSEKKLDLSLETIHSNYGEVMSRKTTSQIIDLLRVLPNGVIRYDQELSSLVETSTNLASIHQEDDTAQLIISTRSSLKSKLEEVRDRIKIIANHYGANVDEDEPYPAWNPDFSSPLLAAAKDTFQRVYGREPEIESTHGGLETGVIGKKVEGLDMIAMGPSIESPHSPDERLEIESVEKFWSFLLEFLSSL